MDIKLICGDALEVLKTLPSGNIDCCITSPPYWGLRDYGTAKWEGGNSECKHNPQRPDGGQREDRALPLSRGGMYKETCGKCGAIRIDNQLGLEKTPEEYVTKIVEVFSEVKRVLKKEGTLWLNLGDSYAGLMKGSNGSGGFSVQSELQKGNKGSFVQPVDWKNVGLKPKDLVGIPWRVAFALQTDGWYLRQDIIWAKPNPMPESVTDRCTKSHEYIFLLSKNSKYYFNNEEIREPNQSKNKQPEFIEKDFVGKENNIRITHGGNKNSDYLNPNGRNKRSVWTVTTKPFKGAHFATFPEDLILPCVLAGCPKEICKKCGNARYPIMKSEYQKKEVEWHPEKYGNGDKDGARRGRMQPTCAVKNTSKNIGWTDCGCNAGFESGTILDLFAGAGTTGVVAKKNNRNFIGIDLNPDYIKMAQRRIDNTMQSLF